MGLGWNLKGIIYIHRSNIYIYNASFFLAQVGSRLDMSSKSIAIADFFGSFRSQL